MSYRIEVIDEGFTVKRDKPCILTAALTALSDVDNDEETRKILSTLSLRQLETRVAQALDDLQNAQNDLASYNSQLVSLQTQPQARFFASANIDRHHNNTGSTAHREMLYGFIALHDHCHNKAE